MKLLMLVWFLSATSTFAQSQYETVSNANPWVSTHIKNIKESGEKSGNSATEIPKIAIYPPGAYRVGTSQFSISDAVGQAVLKLRKYPLLLNGLNIVENSSDNSVAVLRFQPRYILFGKVVARAQTMSRNKVLKMSKRMPVQIFIF